MKTHIHWFDNFEICKICKTAKWFLELPEKEEPKKRKCLGLDCKNTIVSTSERRLCSECFRLIDYQQNPYRYYSSKS